MKHILNHIAFIPDGNRRWAKDQGLSSLEGHRKGYEVFKSLADWCIDRNIPELTFWGLSTENWKRSKEEIGYLMDLFLRVLTTDVGQLTDKGFRFRFIGRRDNFSRKILKAIERAESAVVKDEKGQFNLCFDYGGRPEILEGVRQCLRDGLNPDALTEQQVQERLWSSVMKSDIDLTIRTSGEQRLSGFQPWRASYSELYFSQLHWPGFSQEELDKAITWYAKRNRRFGGDAK